MITDKDMKAQIIEALEDWVTLFDVDKICDEIRATHGLCNINDVPNEVFWKIVEKHEI